ncbi:MAG: hypothetical protein ACK401_01830 [Archaeoglobaceae archaeon]
MWVGRFEHDIEKAAELYLKTAQRFKELGDDSTASFNTNVALALCEQYALQKARKLPSLIHNIIDFTSTVASILIHKRELREDGAGFNFEARVRELIRHFDGRTAFGLLFGLQEDKIVLHRYEEVKEASFIPDDDEIGIVFNDKSPIEIDIMALRKVRRRRFILVCECKYRSRKPITVGDLDLLERKAKFIEKRYEKIARLEGEMKPKVEEKWFVTTGRFENIRFDYAKSHQIRLIDLKKLNDLMGEFGLRKILGPSRGS